MKVQPCWCLPIILSLASATAYAASSNVTLTFVSPASTGVTCTPTAASFTVPVPPGMVLANCAVAPSTWLGSLTITGGPSDIIVSGTQLVVGGTAYDAVGAVTVTAVSAP